MKSNSVQVTQNQGLMASVIQEIGASEACSTCVINGNDAHCRQQEEGEARSDTGSSTPENEDESANELLEMPLNIFAESKI